MLLFTLLRFALSALAAAAAGGIVLGAMWEVRRRLSRQHRTPLRDRLLRTPGHWLREKLDDEVWKLGGIAVGLTLIPAAVIGHAVERVAAGVSPIIESVVAAVVLIPITAAGLIWFARIAKRALRLRVALEAELVAAAELDRLMLHGWRTFHDVPDERCGNLDHVLVGPGGIYVVETKGYLKGRENGDWIAKADAAAGTLTLGGEQRPFPITQLRRNADVLTKILTERTGAAPPVLVEPLLCLPGWRVEATSPATPRTMNPERALSFVTTPRITRPLMPEQVETLARSLDDLCRSVRPALSTRTGESRFGS